MSGTQRPDARPVMREPTSLEAAKARAAEILGSFDVLAESEDKFAAPTPPPGWDYEWKRRTVLNQEDPAYQIALARTGWEPVPVLRHPGMVPAGSAAQTIERDGQVLMQRPLEISDQVRLRDRRRAGEQVAIKEQQLAQTPPNTFGRTDDPRTNPRIKKNFEAVVIPD